MRRQQLVQLLQYVVVWVLIYLFCTFVIKESFVEIILRYRFLFFVISFSYFYYYSIQYEPDKKYELIRNILIYWNLYIIVHVFFRPLLNISHELFILLWLIILGIWWTTKMKTRRKYLLQVVWWVFSFFILLSWMFYFYPDAPDIKWFIENKKYEIVVLWVNEELNKDDAYVQIKDSKWNNNYIIYPDLKINLTENCKISYPSVKKDRKERLFITTPEWRLFLIFPQSEVQLEFEWKNIIKLFKSIWNISTYSWLFDDNIQIIWEIGNIEYLEINELEILDNNYKYELVSYLKNQISDSNISLANNTIMYDIDWKILRFLAKLFPTSFSKNLKNYNEFMNYFSLVKEDDVDLSRYSQKKSKSMPMFFMFWELKDDIKVGIENSYLLNRSKN